MMSKHIHTPKKPAKLERERKTKPRCYYCRRDKKGCVFTNGPWPVQCDKCIEKGHPCSKPMTVSLTRSDRKPVGSPRDGSQCPPGDLPHYRRIGLEPLAALQCDPTSADSSTPATIVSLEDHSRKAILLLSLHSILLMAIKDMIEMAVVMLRPHRRHPTREHTEDCVPTLQRAVHHFKTLAYRVRDSMLSGCETFVRAQDAIDALATPYFLPEFTWGIDSFALEHTRASITRFFNEGHHSLVYVLQVKLLQVGVPPTSDELTRLLRCKQHFMQQLDDMMASGNLNFALPSQWSGCQMFAPRDLVRLPVVAMHILNEGRPDILGRHSFHILSDAGASITWERSGSYIRFLAKDLGAAMWPIEALDSHDILGRTALHIAVRQGSISSVKALSRSGADMHRPCLIGLSLLHIAACHGHAHMVHHLIDKMHYHECAAECYTSTQECQENKTQYLLGIDHPDALLRSPLWYAARGSHIDVMSLLVKRISVRVTSAQWTVIGADSELPDSHGQNAASIAARDGRVDISRFFLGLRGKNWNHLLEPLMINEHLPLAYAVQSRSRECVKLVLGQRQWRFGGPVFKRAIKYAEDNHNEDLRSQLLHLYRSDEAIRTTNPCTGLTYHRPVEIPGVDWSTDLSPLKTRLQNEPQVLDLEQFSVDQIYEVQDSSTFQTTDAVAMQESAADGPTGQIYYG